MTHRTFVLLPIYDGERAPLTDGIPRWTYDELYRAYVESRHLIPAIENGVQLTLHMDEDYSQLFEIVEVNE